MSMFGRPNIEKLKAKHDVRGLIKALGYEKEASVRGKAAQALGELKDPRAVEPLIAMLKDNDKDVRWRSTEALGKLKDPQAVESLITGLKDSNGDVRGAAAKALGELRDPCAIEPLTVTLKDSDSRVRQAAAEALDFIGWQPGQDENGAAYWAAKKEWDSGLFGRKQNAAGIGQPEGDDPALQDPRVPKAISALMFHVTLSPDMETVEGSGSEGPVMAAANLFRELHEAHPQSPNLHFAWAASLQVALQGETAANVLAACVQSHPDFWLAKATQRQNALVNWNPFFLPEFSPQTGAQVHPEINRIVSTNILLATRQGILPRAVIFLRDASDEFAISKLSSCKIEFVTTISEITNPQVVAINGRIHDDPTNPFQCEIIQCPILPFGKKERFPYELFVRQPTYDFVMLDGGGRVKYIRHMTPSDPMKAVHGRLAQMLDTMEGPELSTSELSSAIRRHQSIFDPKKIAY